MYKLYIILIPRETVYRFLFNTLRVLYVFSYRIRAVIFIRRIIIRSQPQIKEVAAPYTSTPELRRFWEHDIRLVRDKNISRDNSSLDSSFYDGLSKTKQRALERTLNEAVREAMNDETFRNVQRFSYGQHGPEEVL